MIRCVDRPPPQKKNENKARILPFDLALWDRERDLPIAIGLTRSAECDARGISLRPAILLSNLGAWMGPRLPGDCTTTVAVTVTVTASNHKLARA